MCVFIRQEDFSQEAELHCPKNYLNLCIQTEPITVGTDATVKVMFFGQIRNM